MRMAVVVIGLFVLAGCGSSLQNGVGEFDRARYPEAIRALRDSEAESAQWNAVDRTRYALYRGLTHLALGDRIATLQWLSEAKRALDACPDLLPADEAGQLAAAWSHLPSDAPQLVEPPP